MTESEIGLLVLGIVSGLLGVFLGGTNAALNSVRDGVLHAALEGRFEGLARRMIDDRGTIRARLRLGRSLGSGLAALGVAGALLRPIGSIAAVAGVALGVVFVLSLLGSTLAAILRRKGLEATLRALRLCRPFELLLAPFAAPIAALASWVGRNGGPPREAATQVKHLIDVGEAEGELPRDQAELMRNLLEFDKTLAREVMVPRGKMVALSVDTPLEEALQTIAQSGHSRYPVYQDAPDQMVGIVYAKDAFAEMLKEREGGKILTLASLVRPAPLFASETQLVGPLLRQMQTEKHHLAILVDEFGGVAGLVTLEDILEEIVGEIEDEHDDEDQALVELGPGRFVADGSASVYDIAALLDPPLPTDGDFDSLGGMLIELAGGIPGPGERLRSGEYELRAIASNERAVTRVEIAHRPEVA